jgi:hypothetical protein
MFLELLSDSQIAGGSPVAFNGISVNKIDSKLITNCQSRANSKGINKF